jgi:hypothetical protein
MSARTLLAVTACGMAACGVIAASALAADPQAMLDRYVAAAVASETCRGKALSMVEELALGRIVKAESGGALSSVSVLDGLSRARRGARPDCASAAVQEDVRDFVARVLPQLQWGSSQPAPSLLPAAAR